ncbi:MAG: phosphoribosylanthranilate isomerase [Chitinophagaceae bacterium]|nr:MAG: phosphoribosylanthranilate isomerase [Chitinophagaceae bacterium]
MSSIKKTGVFVNEEVDNIAAIVNKYRLDAVQLHGQETPEACKELKDKLGVIMIKAFPVTENFDFEQLRTYTSVVDHFLFDTPTASHGGSGKLFDWSNLERYPFYNTYFLSGGIGVDQVDEILALRDHRLFAVDVNSRFETAPGIKNIAQLNSFFKALKG